MPSFHSSFSFPDFHLSVSFSFPDFHLSVSFSFGLQQDPVRDKYFRQIQSENYNERFIPGIIYLKLYSVTGTLILIFLINILAIFLIYEQIFLKSLTSEKRKPLPLKSNRRSFL